MKVVNEINERSSLLPEHQPAPEPVHKDKDGGKPSVTRIVSIVVALLGVFLANADDSFVMATYQTIASQYQQLSDAPFLLTAYNLGYCIALPVYAAASDTTGGRKKPLLVAYLLFGLGCLISGLGFSLGQVIAGRVIAGFGGAGMIAMVSVIITDIVTLDRVAILRGYVNVVGIIGRSFGGPVGGFLADTIGWRWSFLGQAPIALVCFFLAGLYLPAGSANAGKPAADADGASGIHSSGREVDYLGTALFAATVTNFLLLLNLGGEKLPWDHPVVIVMSFSCALLFLAFLLTEGLIAKKPLIPLRLVTVNGVGIFCLVQTLVFFAKSATISNVAPYLVQTQHASNTEAANYLVPPSVCYAFGALASGYIMGRTYKYKALALMSVVMGIVSHGLIALRWRHGTNFWEAMYLLPVGIAFGMLLSTQFVHVSASAPKAQLATVISMYYLSQQLGEILGTSTAAAIVRAEFRKTLLQRLGDGLDAKRTIGRILEDARFSFTLPPAIQEIVRSSYLYSFQFAPISSAACYVVVLGFVLYMKEQPLR